MAESMAEIACFMSLLSGLGYSKVTISAEIARSAIELLEEIL